MTSEWVKWKDMKEDDDRWGDTTVVDKGSYQIHTQHAIRGPNAKKPPSIEESIRRAKESHRKIFEDNRATEGFAPTALIIDPEGLWTAVCCPDWSEMKEDARLEIHRVALRERAVAMVWGSDSFYLERDAEKVDNNNWENMEAPSKAPDRKEAFIITTIWPDGTAYMEMYPYKIENKKLVWLPGERVPDADTKCEQRICPAWAVGGTEAIQ